MASGAAGATGGTIGSGGTGGSGGIGATGGAGGSSGANAGGSAGAPVGGSTGTGGSTVVDAAVDSGADVSDGKPGVCDHICSPPTSGAGAGVCMNGTCGITCTSGSACGTSCVDLSIDFFNCGMCGHPCATGSACVTGVCLPKLIVSDTTWKTIAGGGTPPPAEWTLANFDDSAWNIATVVADAGSPPNGYISGYVFSGNSPAKWIWDANADFYSGIFARKKFVAATASMTVHIAANNCFIIDGADPPAPTNLMLGDLNHQCFDFPKQGAQYTVTVNPGQTYYLALRTGPNIDTSQLPNGLIVEILFQ